ncbi:MAG: hypothetical protein V1859_11385 [archaeon]
MPNDIYQQRFYQPFIDLEHFTEVKDKVESIFPLENHRTKKHLVLYIINLICSANGKIAVSRDRLWFKRNIPKCWHSVRLAIKSQDLLISKGLVTYEQGRNARPGYISGFASRLVKTDEFDRQFGSIQIISLKLDSNECFDLIYREAVIPENIPDEYSFESYINNIKIKILNRNETTLTYKLVDGDNSPETCNLNLPLSDSSNFRKIALNTYLLNTEYFNNITLGFDSEIEKEMIRNIYLTRIFTPLGCGRFFQQHSISYQNIKKENRSHLLINGQQTAEVDYQGMHINLLYAKERLPCFVGDTYMPIVVKLIGSENSALRDAVKKCVLIAINAKSLNSYKKAIRWNEPDVIKTLSEFSIKPKKVIEAFAEVHPNIAHHLNSNASLDLMYEDSNIMEKVLFKLKELEIYGCPLHDSIICPSQHIDDVKRVMRETYFQVTGFEITVV